MSRPSPSVKKMIACLGLTKHPEGGFFSETYRSRETLRRESLAARFRGSRSISTAIVYLLERGDFSALHRIQSDELWHYYAGAPLEIVMLSPKGQVTKVFLGLDFKKGERPQICVPHGVWFGAAISKRSRGRYTLAGCTVAPGFDFKDFEMAKRTDLIKKFPARKNFILKWTRLSAEAKVS